MRKKFKHLTYEDRLAIRAMLDRGASVTTIAKTIGLHYSSAAREIERGRDASGIYNPDYAQQRYENNLKEKGPPSILGSNQELAKYISSLILQEGLSPERIIERLESERAFSDYPKSRATIYSAIDNGEIPGVTRESLMPDTTRLFNGCQIQISKRFQEQLRLHDGMEMKMWISEDGVLCYKPIYADDRSENR